MDEFILLLVCLHGVAEKVGEKGMPARVTGFVVVVLELRGSVAGTASREGDGMGGFYEGAFFF
jgi:hypothetical protein